MSSPPMDTNIVLLFGDIAFRITDLSSPSNSSDPSKSGSNVKVIIPSAVIGALVLILLVFAVILLRRRRERGNEMAFKAQQPFVIATPVIFEDSGEKPPGTAASSEPLFSQSQAQSNYASHTPVNYTELSPPNTANTVDGARPPGPTTNTKTDSRHLSVFQSTSPSSIFSNATYATAPPSYPQTTGTVQNSTLMLTSGSGSTSRTRSRRTANTLNTRLPGPTLAEFANENRDLIPEELESKLMKVGYLPGDNPDAIPPDEWVSLYGVSRVELVRIKQFHER